MATSYTGICDNCSYIAIIHSLTNFITQVTTKSVLTYYTTSTLLIPLLLLRISIVIILWSCDRWWWSACQTLLSMSEST